MTEAVRAPTPEGLNETVVLRPRGLQHERYEIGAILGEGGMGVVYRARDRRDGREVALKVMKSALAGTSRRRFEREFQTIAALEHPSCIRVYEYGEIEAAPFFTMELFAGRPVSSLAGLGLDAVLRPLLGLSLALDYIHKHGIVHRDVKPSNVLVRPALGPDGEPGHELRLMDFGLAKYYGVHSSLSAEAGFVGTVAYCAPEQINNDELDHRADLYCLGLVGYELLGGRYAFPEARLAGVRPLMQAQLGEKPRPLGEVNPAVPGPIADAVMRYLRKPAHRRPDSAALLRDAIAAHLRLDVEPEGRLSSPGRARPGLSVTGFVCRTREREELEDLLRRSLRPGAGALAADLPPPLVLVVGEPGIGKSSVVQEAERIARGHGCQVYEGRCFDGNLAPFQPFLDVLRQVIAGLRLQERRAAEASPDDDLTATRVSWLPAEVTVRLTAVVREYSGVLLRVAPELGKYLPGEAYRQVEFGREADSLYRVLASFFLEVATVQPICLSFEDLQWADKGSLDLLRHLTPAAAEARRTARGGPGTAPRVVILGSARSGFSQLEEFVLPLRERRLVREMDLAPLTEEEARELIALRLNCRPEELSDLLVTRVHGLCGGNPFFVAETVREWYEKSAITRGDAGWDLKAEAADATDLPETVRDVMRLRLQGLPEKVQRVLNAAAVLGAVVDIDLLREVVPELSESDVLDAIDALLPRRVFRETGNAGRVEFVHDLLREMPYADLTASRRRSLHRRVGELLERAREAGAPVPAAVLANHFRLAEEASKAFGYLLEAGAAAIEAGAYRDALVSLDQALAAAPGDTAAGARYRLWSLLGQANGAARQTARALDCYREAAGHAPDVISHAHALAGIGAMHEQNGELTLARAFLRRAFIESRSWPTAWPLDLGKSLISLALPARPRAAPGEAGRRREVALQATLDLGGIASVQTEHREGIRLAFRALAIAKTTGDPDQYALAHSRFVLRLAVHGGRFAGRFLRRAEANAESCRSPVSRSFAMGSVAMATYWAGDLRHAIDLGQRVRPLLERHSHWYLYHNLTMLRRSNLLLGRYAASLDFARALLAIGEQTGNLLFRSSGELGIASTLAHRGEFAEAVARSKQALALSTQMSGQLLRPTAVAAHGQVLLLASRYEEASATLEEALEYLSKNKFHTDYVVPAYALQAESLLGPGWAVAGAGRHEALRAWRLTRRGVLVGRVFPNVLAHALRASGRAAYALGRPRLAARRLERAIAAAESLGSPYHCARALLDAAVVSPEKAERYRRQAGQILEEIGAVVPEAERIGPG